jgi:hypothetical protein
MKKKFSAILFLFVLQIVMSGACNSDTREKSSNTRSYLGTQMPGDVWEWFIDGGSETFQASNNTLSYDYSGTFVELPNKFLKLTVEMSTEPGFSTPASAYALEVPNSLLFVKPLSASSEMIVCTARGACPASPDTYNWVQLLDFPFSLTHNAYGISEMTISGLDYDFAHTTYQINGTVSGISASTGFRCATGELTHPVDPVVIGITPSGLFVGDSGPGAGGFVGIDTPAAPLVTADIIAAGREFRGLLFSDSSTGSETKPIWVRPNGSGGLSGGDYDDFEAGIEHFPPRATIELGTQVQPGVFNGTLTDDIGTVHIVSIVNLIDGKYFLFAAGYSSHRSDEPYNFLLIEM